MPSADQVPVKSTHSNDAVARVGCPDRQIDRLCITCCSPYQLVVNVKTAKYPASLKCPPVARVVQGPMGGGVA